MYVQTSSNDTPQFCIGFEGSFAALYEIHYMNAQFVYELLFHVCPFLLHTYMYIEPL